MYSSGGTNSINKSKKYLTNILTGTKYYVIMNMSGG